MSRDGDGSVPALSVVMPIYNGAPTLRATLASLEEQGLERLGEIVAVDQASSDGSRAILKSAAERLPIRIVDAPHSRSWTETTNIGLAAARAPLVTMLHQDDLWRPGRAQALLALAERHPKARLWLHPADFVDGAGRVIGRFGPPFGRRERLVPFAEVLATLLVQNTVALPAAMFRRADALSAGGLDTRLWYTADWDLWLRLAKLGPVAWSPARLAAFRIHDGSQTVSGSRDRESFAEQHRLPLERHIGALDEPERRRVRALADAAAEINLALAACLHGQAHPLGPLSARLLRLGPHRWPALLARSQIVQRSWPRLRLLRRERRGGAR